jgi:hypothetical protein
MQAATCLHSFVLRLSGGGSGGELSSYKANRSVNADCGSGASHAH